MATITWKVNSSGNWSTATNWGLGRIPAAGDAVVINTASPITVTYDSASPSVSVKSLTVGADNFDVAGGNTLSITTSASFGGLLEVDAGVLNFNTVSASIASFDQTGGTISGTGTLTVSGAATFSGAGYDAETGTGTTLLQGTTTDSASFYVTLDGGRVLENAGTFNVTGSGGGFYLGYNPAGAVGGGTIQNDSGATFDFQTASAVYNNMGATGFTNAGTLEQTLTTGTTDIQVALTNTGAVSVQTGTLEFDGGGTSTGGTFTVASGATLDFDSGAFTLSGGTYNASGTTEISGSAAVNLTGGTVTSLGALAVTAGTLNVATSATAASLTQTGGTISGTGTLTVSGAATFGGFNYDVETGTGTTLLQGTTTYSGPYITLDGGRVLENAGTFNVNATSGYGNFYLGYNPFGTTASGGTIQNDFGATFDFQAASNVYNNTGATGFTNAGTLEQTLTTGTTDIQVALTNTGAVSVQTGTLEFDGGGTSTGGTFTVASGATLDFDAGTFTLSGGTYNASGTTEISGSATTNFAGASVTSLGALAVTAGTLNLAASVTAASLTQTGGTISGTGTLTVSGAATFGGFNYDVETGTGTTLLQGTTTYSGPYITLDGGRVLENAGTFNVNATSGYGNFYLGYNPFGTTAGGGTIQNDFGATFDFQAASNVYNNTGANAFVNAGTLEQTVTTGTTDIQVALTNTGTVSVQTGTLEFDGGGTATGGTFAVASGATLDFNGGTFTLSGGSIGGAGIAEVTGGTVNVSGATVTTIGALNFTAGTFNVATTATAASLTQTGGTIAGAGTLTVSGTATLSGSSYDQEIGTGTTLLQGTTTESGATYITLDGGRVLENAGTFNVNGAAGYGIQLGVNVYGTTVGGATIQNDVGGTFDFQAASTIINNTGANTFVNTGTLEQTVTAGTTDIQVALTNTGAVSVQTGTLQLDGGGTSTAGTFTVASGAALRFNGGTFTLAGDSSSGAGVVQLSGGTLATATGATIASGFSQTGGTLAGAGTLAVSGAATFGGGSYDQETGTGTTLLQGTTTESGATYITLDGGRVLENAGTFNVNGTAGYGFQLGVNVYGTTVGGATIQNDLGGTFDFQTASTIINNTGTIAFVNAGTLEQTVTTGTTDIQVALTNTGAVSVQKGTLQFDGGGASTAGAFTVASGAKLAFNAGTFTLSGGSIGGAGAVAVTGGTLAIGASFIDSANLNLSTSGAGALALNGNTLTLAGASNALTGAVSGAGTLKVTGAATLTTLTAGAVGSPVTIEDAGSVTLAGADTLTGALQIDAGANATISGTLSAGASVNFNGAGATLSLSAPASFTDTIGGVGFDDTIFLKGITGTSATLNGSNQVVVKNGATTVKTLQLSGSNSGFAFVTQAVTGGTNVVALPKIATVAQYLAVTALYDTISGGFAISDTAANIASGLDSLNDVKINSITVSDNAAVGASVAQMTSDATAIGKLKNANATPYQLAISDTAANVLAGLATLETNVAHIASITASGGPVSVNISTFSADQAVLDKISGGFAIADIAANITSALNTLSDANIQSITISDNANVGASVAQLISDATAVGKLANANATPYQLAISDTASNVLAGLATLETNVAHIASIAASGGSVSVNISTFSADQAALDKISGGFTIADIAANISSALNALGDSNILSITISDNAPIGASIAQLTSDAAAIGKLANQNAMPVTFAVTDTAAHITAALDSLDGTNIASITISDNAAIGVSVGQLTSDATAIGKLANANATPYQLAVIDTATDITSALDPLNGSKIASITISDNAAIGVSIAQLTADAIAIGKLADASATPYQLAVTDTAAHIAAALDSLDGAHIGSITISDNATIGASIAQLTSDATAIGKLANASATPYQLAISDTTANVTSALAGLETRIAHLASITAAGGPVTVSKATFAADQAALDKIVGGFAVSDTLPNIVSSLATFNLDPHIDSLTGTSGSATLSGGVAVAAPAFSLTGVGTTLTVAENLAYSGALTIGAGANASVSTSDTLTLTGADALDGSVLGAGTLAIAGGAATIAAGATITASKWTISGAGTSVTFGGPLTYAGTFSAGVGDILDLSGGGLTLNGTSTLSGTVIGGTFSLFNAKTLTGKGGAVTIGDTSGNVGKITNMATGTWNIIDASGIGHGLSTASSFINSGLFEKTGGTGNAIISASFVNNSTGTVNAATGTLTFSGPSTALGGKLTGAGTIAIAGGAATIKSGTSVTVAKLTESGATTALSIAGNLVYSGVFSASTGSTTVSSGATLTLTGTTTLGASVGGLGTLAIAGGTATLNGGGGLAVANWAISGAGTSLVLAKGLNYNGTFSAGSGATLNLSAGNLTLKGANSFAGATLTSVGHILTDSGAAAISGLTIGGTTTFTNTKTLTESGGAVTLGDLSGNAAKIVNTTTGTWDITDDGGIGLGSSALSSITNSGLFEKTGGAGTSVIAPAFANAHNILVSSGTLDFKGAVTSTGTDTISGASTLEFGSTLAAGQTVNFSGTGGTLDLADPLGYGGSHIGGFAATDSVDLNGAWSLVSGGFSENAGGTLATLTLTDLASDHVKLNFAGNFTQRDFNITTGANTTIGHT